MNHDDAPMRVAWTTLAHLVADFGRAGGHISPSVYDTAQLLRLAPPREGVHPALDWLCAQQYPDGGWGDPSVPRARDLPTLAAVLALHRYRTYPGAIAAIDRGLHFLRRQAAHWSPPLPQDLPIGVELLLPALLDQAAAQGLDLPQAPYAALQAIGTRRRSLIAQACPGAGTTAAHSWEAWGTTPDLRYLDASGGVGHSPAATAAWLQRAQAHPQLAAACDRARRYLAHAAAATGVGIAGVVPTVWPIDRFEQGFGLYALLAAGLLTHPQLWPAVQPHCAALAAALPPAGISFSSHFAPDGDDTAVAITVLAAAGVAVNATPLQHFAIGDLFCTWKGELQPSLSTTAHGLHALALCQLPLDRPCAFVLQRQEHDGRWQGDKWHGSWLYATSQSMLALHAAGQSGAVQTGAAALLARQHPNGGWGMAKPSTTETAYAVLALAPLLRAGELRPPAQQGLARALRALRHPERAHLDPAPRCWLGKEVYRPERVDQVFELCARLALHAAEIGAPLQARHYGADRIHTIERSTP